MPTNHTQIKLTPTSMFRLLSISGVAVCSGIVLIFDVRFVYLAKPTQGAGTALFQNGQSIWKDRIEEWRSQLGFLQVPLDRSIDRFSSRNPLKKLKHKKLNISAGIWQKITDVPMFMFYHPHLEKHHIRDIFPVTLRNLRTAPIALTTPGQYQPLQGKPKHWKKRRQTKI